jgi:hypothetical protein
VPIWPLGNAAAIGASLSVVRTPSRAAQADVPASAVAAPAVSCDSQGGPVE